MVIEDVFGKEEEKKLTPLFLPVHCMQVHSGDGISVKAFNEVINQ
jgi:hypothetical protein